ncbi:ketopantoate reductase PanE/ApbA-domain-containing protein [Phycomyces nitens]|nr:ketopantoate reductase PanE/ApbA-domain-containing protein [Phycomyces nitens]
MFSLRPAVPIHIRLCHTRTFSFVSGATRRPNVLSLKQTDSVWMTHGQSGQWDKPKIGQTASTSPFFFHKLARLYSSMAERSTRIMVVGTGAVGSIYAWRLSKSANVTAVCRSNYEIVKNTGLEIDSKKFGKETFKPDNVVRTVSEGVTSEPFDYIVVTLKALPEIYNVAEIIAPAVTKGKTTVVLIQNGLGVEEPITEAFPENPIVSIVAYIGTSQISPGQILMVGGESLIVGDYKAAPVDSTAQREKFADLLEKGGVTVQKVDDVERVRWQKIFWNASFSPVCAITHMTTSDVLRNKEAMKSVKNLMSEVIQTANAMGYDFNEQEQMAAMIEKTEATALNYKPSMQLDLERGQPMEVEVILGTPLRRAALKGLSVPHLEMMHDLCSAINSHNMYEKAQL